MLCQQHCKSIIRRQNNKTVALDCIRNRFRLLHWSNENKYYKRNGSKLSTEAGQTTSVDELATQLALLRLCCTTNPSLLVSEPDRLVNEKRTLTCLSPVFISKQKSSPKGDFSNFYIFDNPLNGFTSYREWDIVLFEMIQKSQFQWTVMSDRRVS